LALLVPAAVPSDYEDYLEQLLAVPEELEVWSEDETCSWLLLDTEASGTPGMERNGTYHEAEHGVTAPMEPPAEAAPPMLENAGQPLKQHFGCPQKALLASTFYGD
jgi:hypothetical protein